MASHHGSLSREMRLRAEEQLKAGELKAIVATASLELGIDIGYIDLVCQIGSPRSIATFLQRVGRAGHALGRIPKGRLFALTRDELLEALALVRRGAARASSIASRCRSRRSIFWPSRSWPRSPARIGTKTSCSRCAARPGRIAILTRDDFDAIVGNAERRHRAGQSHRRVSAPRSDQSSAACRGGMRGSRRSLPAARFPRRPTTASSPKASGTFVGTLNEDFAIESQAGNVFQLGNTSWRIHVRARRRGDGARCPRRPGDRAVLARRSAGPDGRAVGELSRTARGDLGSSASESVEQAPSSWLQATKPASTNGRRSKRSNYVASQGAAIGLVPTQRQVVFERFFDESGGMQLVIHAPFGARINAPGAWRCGSASAARSISSCRPAPTTTASCSRSGRSTAFRSSSCSRCSIRRSPKTLLVQALLAVPMFGVRWRWNVTRALAVLRQRGGKKVPPHLQRFRADDLLTAVFPMQTACFEHRTGDLEPPDHPLVQQTVHDCLHEAMDFDGWLSVLRRDRGGPTSSWSPATRASRRRSAISLLNANRTRFSTMRRWKSGGRGPSPCGGSFRADDVRDLGQLDPEAIAQVRSRGLAAGARCRGAARHAAVGRRAAGTRRRRVAAVLRRTWSSRAGRRGAKSRTARRCGSRSSNGRRCAPRLRLSIRSPPASLPESLQRGSRRR